MLILLFCSSCNYTPEERAEKVVKDYISAIRYDNYRKQYSLTYDIPTQVCEVIDSEDSEEPLTSDLDITVNKRCAIKKDTKFVIKSVNLIYSKIKKQDKETITEEATEEATEVILEEDESPYGTKSNASNATISWPSDVNAAYNVDVTSGNHEITFTVVQISKKEYKIYSTKGLYVYDFDIFSSITGCDVALPDANDDKIMEQYVSRLIDNIKTFDIFSKAIAANDTTKIIRIFPALKNFDYNLNGKLTPKTYTYNDRNTIIRITDTLAFEFSPDGKITDSYGVISTKKEEDAVKALDATPYSRNGLFDIQYIYKLNNQVSSITQEKERKAKAAKYKSQGVALISSQLSNGSNGEKGIKFSALNTSNKTAKYIIIEVVGYNSVDDPIWSDGYIKRCRGIGPLDAGEGGTWDFNEIWKNGSIVDSYEIKKLTIEFSDGTSKSVKLPQSLPSNWRNWLY